MVELVRGIKLLRGGPTSFPVPDRPRVVSIFGTRGTGKSTTLHFAAHQLRDVEDHLVLPVIDPESFAPGDSLAGWVLAYLDQNLQESERSFESGASHGRTLDQILTDLRRAQSVRAAEYLPGLGRRGLSFDDFARDAMKIPAHGIRMSDRFATVLDHLAEVRGRPELRLIISVDDADLFPELLPGIVGDAQMLGSSVRATVLFAADPQTLSSSLRLSYLSTHSQGSATALTHGLLGAQEIRELIGRRLVKHFPRSLRVHLPTLSQGQRLAFKPLEGEDSTLIDMLERFPIRDDSGRTLADMFTIRAESGAKLGPSPYAAALSGNARDIRQLHEALSVIDASSPHSASRALGVIVEHGLEGLEAELPSPAAGVVRLGGSRERPSALFDFSTVSFGKGTMGGTIAYMRVEEESGTAIVPDTAKGVPDGTYPRSPVVIFRRIARHYNRMELSEQAKIAEATDPSATARTEDPQAPTAADELPTQYTYLMLIAWEAVQGAPGQSLLLSDGFVDSPAQPGGMNWTDTVTGNDSTLNWAYWTVPIWEGHSDYALHQEGWSRLIQAVDARRDPDLTNSRVLEIALLAHLALVAAIQLRRAVPDWVAEIDRDWLAERECSDMWEEEREEIQKTVEGDLEEALAAGRVSSRSGRDTDFGVWFERHLPLAATPLLTTEAMSKWVVALWKKHVPARTRESCANAVAKLAGEHIANSLSDGDIELLKLVEPVIDEHEPRWQRLEDLRAEYRERRLQKQVQLSRSLENAGAEPLLVDALKREGATRETLLGLMREGMRPEFVSEIVDAFPVIQRVEVAGVEEQMEKRDIPPPPEP